VSNRPAFGFTRHGLPVHARVIDHHPGGSQYQRFNKAVALPLTRYIGTMTCFWVFCCLSLCSMILLVTLGALSARLAGSQFLR
jgi:hypothetical protein